MNKKGIILFLISLYCGISEAIAFDFSSIDPRVAENNSPTKQSSVFKQTATPTQTIEETNLVPLRSSNVKIVAIVNDEIISTEDIDNRINAFIMTTQIPMNDETKGMIYQKVLTATIDEKLKVQEAKRNNINVTDEDINASIVNFAETNKIPLEKVPALLRKNGISERAFREQMASDIAWLRLIRQKNRTSDMITEQDINSELERAKKDFATPKLMISEIMIKQEKAKDLNNLVETLKKDPRFELYAFRFSDSPTASNGGKLGWVNKESLPEPIAQAVKTMNVNDISYPIKVGNDYYIIKVEQSFDPSKDKVNMPTREDIKRFLENQKIDILATQYIQNLRQKAVIEFRG